ncbi:MAG TPA: hypothetical protein VMF11_04410 [Candidatus Baltobacteraceae bacterium]|nr:hypothetical protein [Candidatus Baltobacteraceae bacterium]
MEYFTEREHGLRPRTIDSSTSEADVGLRAIIDTFVGRNFFAEYYPVTCPDGRGVVGTDVGLLERDANGRNIRWTDAPSESQDQLFDLIEFSFSRLSKPRERDYHDYFGHSHLIFDRSEGQRELRDAVNEVFRRHGLAFELNGSGRVTRLFPAEQAAVLNMPFSTGDASLDDLLAAARTKFIDPRPEVRKEALEKLWDAWERLKTLEDPDKKVSVSALVARTSSQASFRELMEEEAKTLTQIGNSFMIRHSEIGRTPIDTSLEIDYLFLRCHGTIMTLLRASGRA